MLKPQKKVSKKEIKEDKLVTQYFAIRSWIDQNQRLAMYIVATPIVIVLLWFWWNSKRAEWNETATTQLAKIIPYYDEGKYDQAIQGVPQEGAQGLKAIVDEYGSTPAGEIAKIYLANAYFQKKEYDQALEYYDDISVSDNMIEASALAGMAACYEAQGKYKDAAKYFEKAAAKNMVLTQAPDNLQRAAINYAAVGEKNKAKELLETIKKEFPTSSQARDIDRYIAEICS